MKPLFLLRMMIAASVMALMAASTGYMFVGGPVLFAVTKASFIAFGVSALVIVGQLLFSEYRQSTH